MKRVKIQKVSLSKSTPLRDIYAEYKSRYNQKASQISAYYGADMYAGMSPNERNFGMLLSGMREKYPNMSMNKLVDKLVDRQSSKLTWSSASRLASNPHDILRARYDASYIYQEIDDSYHKMRDDGLDSREAGYLISNYYFGSK